MTHEATMRLRFASEDEARRMLAAIEPENGRHLQAHVEGDMLVATARAASPLALLHTLDDALACLAAAEKAARVAGSEAGSG